MPQAYGSPWPANDLVVTSASASYDANKLGQAGGSVTKDDLKIFSIAGIDNRAKGTQANQFLDTARTTLFGLPNSNTEDTANVILKSSDTLPGRTFSFTLNAPMVKINYPTFDVINSKTDYKLVWTVPIPKKATLLLDYWINFNLAIALDGDPTKSVVYTLVECYNGYISNASLIFQALSPDDGTTWKDILSTSVGTAITRLVLFEGMVPYPLGTKMRWLMYNTNNPEIKTTIDF